MADQDAENLLSPDDAFSLASKIVEMAERVKVADRCLPGSAARWKFEMDGDEFDVVVRVHKDGKDGG